MFSFALFGILFKLWQRGIHLVPRMRVGRPHIHLWVEPAPIIQAGSSDRDKLWGRVGLAKNRRAAVRTKGPMGLATRLTRRGMEAWGAFQELERLRRHDDERGKRTSAGSLAISTVTVKQHNRFCRGFVANRAASASVSEGCGYCGHILFVQKLHFDQRAKTLSPLPVSR